MPRSTSVYALALCSPTGLEEDREAVRAAINETNKSLARDDRRVEVLAWDTDVRPSIGTDAQDVVNRQIIDQADVGLVLIGDNLGSPTPRSPSGTVEEVRSFVTRKKEGADVDLMLFFKRVPVRYDRSALERMQAIVEFREEMQSEGVFWKEYETVEELAEAVRLHLPNTIHALGVVTNSPTPDLGGSVVTTVAPVEEGAEEGALDHEIAFAEAMEVISNSMEAVGAGASKSGELMTQISQEMGAMADRPRNPIALRSLSNRLGESLDGYADVIEVETGRFEVASDIALNSTIALLGLVGSGEVNSDAEELKSLAKTLEGSRLEMIGMASTVRGASEMLDGFPRLTKELGRAKHRAVVQSNRLEAAVNRMADRLSEAAQAARERAKQMEPVILPGLGG